MSLKHLDQLLKPRSIAVIGASNQDNRPGNIVMRNLLQGGFDGPILPVTPNYKSVCGVLAYRSIDELPIAPDLAIVCTRAMRVPAILLQLGRKGASAVIVIAAGLDKLFTAQGTNLQELMESIGKQWNLRILGPNSLGLIVPRLGLNASYAQTQALPGKIAVLSQSTAVCVTLLDWAKRRRIGFSSVVDLGEGQDIDFDEMLDYFGRDPNTTAILLYVDAVRDGRRFVSAARAASVNKRILVIKAGQQLESQLLLTGQPAETIGRDEVYDAIFKRAGMLRVGDLRELLAAVETLANGKPIQGEQLVVISNGNAPAAMVLDILNRQGGRLQTLSDEVVSELKGVIRSGGRATNPINLLGDASPEDYQKAIAILLATSTTENILVLHSPSALIPGEKYAEAVIETLRKFKGTKANVFANWLGEDAAVAARQTFADAEIASFRTPEGAAGAFMHMVQFRRNQKLLSETPDSVSDEIPHRPERAQEIIEQARLQQQIQLSREQATELLSAYGIATVPTKNAQTIDDAVTQAVAIGFPVALKVDLPNNLTLKSDRGGVVLNLNSPQEVREAATRSAANIQETFPEIAPHGFTLQAMARRTGTHQVRIDVMTDPIFGPAIFLGEVSSHWDPSKNAVVGMPPLNMALARYLVIQSLAEQKIRERELNTPLNRLALCTLLTQVSQLIVDNPAITSLSINPALVSENEIRVLDASVDIDIHSHRPPLAIRPYPKELEETATLHNGEPIIIRPLRAEDEINLQLFDSAQSKEDRYKRYFGEMPTFSHEQMVRLTQLDYEREMAFIAVSKHAETLGNILGVVRAQQDPDNQQAEFAMAIRSDLKGQGIGSKLLQKMVNYCRQNGTEELTGTTMINNAGMANLARKLGFTVRFNREDDVIEMKLPLQNGME